MRTWNQFVAVGAVLATVAAVSGQQRANQSTPPLAVSDYQAIEQLYARYAHAFDTAADNGKGAAALFTPDGVFVDDRGNAVEGREDLVAWARGAGSKSPTRAGQFLTNVWINPAPLGASVKAYVAMITMGADEQPAKTTNGGVYQDSVVKTPEGWRFKVKHFIQVNTPYSTPPQLTPTGSMMTPPGPPGTLSAQDYAEIRQLYARYSFGLEGGDKDGYGWADVFTPDGVHINATGNGQFKSEHFEGREILAAFASGRLPEQRVTGSGENPKAIRLTVAHFVSNIMIAPTPEGAMSRAYLIRPGTAGIGLPNGRGGISGGIYYDTAVRTPQGWRFKRKSFITAEAAVPLAGPDSVPDAHKKPVSWAYAARDANHTGSTFSASDYEEIQQLYARYNHGLDSGADHGESFASVFTPDGANVDSNGTVTEGRERLAALARGEDRGPSHVSHYLMNLSIEPGQKEVTGRAYVLTARIGQPSGSAITGGGLSIDTLVMTPDGWRFKKRTFTKQERLWQD